ncbi:MAG: glycosyltransferase family 4 protein [Leptospiraceae bacterium]|nr:glycosyltransferase family 4 protein [Leptospiraceae bacterium]MDW7977065.1 glycosyltransferase family 1 protein [Leptospiraceae bacterium]
MPHLVAVDGRPLSSPVSGISRLISKIIENFDMDFEFHLFSHLPIHDDFKFLLKKPNVVWHENQSLFKKGGSWYIFHFPREIRKLKPKIYWGTQQTIPPFLSKNIKKVLTILDFVSYYYPDSMRKIALFQQRLLMRQSFQKADFFISISHQTQDDLVKLYLKNHKKHLKVIHLGFDPPKEFSKEIPISIKQPYILSVSTIEPRKNYTTLLEAYYQYYQQEKEQAYSLVIVGKRGWETSSFYKKLDEFTKKTQSIYVLDNINDQQLYSLYYHAAFFCMPSLYEGFGLPVLEALSFQKHVILSDIPCFKEIAKDYGIFLSPYDTKAWAETIKDFVQLHRNQKLPPVNFPTELWSWKKVAQNYKEVFNSLI